MASQRERDEYRWESIEKRAVERRRAWMRRLFVSYKKKALVAYGGPGQMESPAIARGAREVERKLARSSARVRLLRQRVARRGRFAWIRALFARSGSYRLRRLELLDELMREDGSSNLEERFERDALASEFTGEERRDWRQERALIVLYECTGGRRWRHRWWTSPGEFRRWRRRGYGTWRGVTVDWEGRVTELDLSANNLEGRLPRELGDLNDLRILRLADNRLRGEIPDEYGFGSRLEVLDVSGNELSGWVPRGLRTSLIELRADEDNLPCAESPNVAAGSQSTMSAQPSGEPSARAAGPGNYTAALVHAETVLRGMEKPFDSSSEIATVLKSCRRLAELLKEDLGRIPTADGVGEDVEAILRELTEVRDEAAKIERQVEDAERGRGVLGARQSELESAKSELEARRSELEDRRSRLERQKEALRNSRADLEDAEGSLKGASGEIRDVLTSSKRLAELLKEKLAKIPTAERLGQEAKEIVSELTEVSDEAANIEREVEGTERARARLGARRSELETAQSELEATKSGLEDQKTELERQEGALRKRRADLEVAEGSLKELREQIAEVTERVAEMEDGADFGLRVSATGQRFHDTVEAFLEGERRVLDTLEGIKRMLECHHEDDAQIAGALGKLDDSERSGEVLALVDGIKDDLGSLDRELKSWSLRLRAP